MAKVKVSSLKQSPYVFATGARVDPTREGVQKAIDEGRFSLRGMDQHYWNEIAPEIQNKTQDPVEQDRLMHEYHNERIAELVRTKDVWLGDSDPFPITVNQFNHVIAGNHRFRAVRYLGLEEVDVAVTQEAKPHPQYALSEIWE